MNELQIFNYNNKEIRTIVKGDEAWFVGKDVAEALGYEAPRNALKKFVEDEDKQVHRISASGQMREVFIINEAGLYSLIFSSKLPSAKQFKHWVTHEVLPDIRKHGMYMTDKLRDAAQVDKKTFDTVVKKYLAEKGKVKALTEQIAADAPYTVLGKVVRRLPGTITPADAAQSMRQRGIKIGRNTLYRILRNKEYLSIQKKRWNKPTQKGIDSGIVNIELIEPGVYILSPHAMITAEGLEKISNELFADEYPLAALWELTEEDEKDGEEEVS